MEIVQSPIQNMKERLFPGYSKIIVNYLAILKVISTLLTCTPYGVNTHRLLVRGVRTAYKQNQEQKISILKDYPQYTIFQILEELELTSSRC